MSIKLNYRSVQIQVPAKSYLLAFIIIGNLLAPLFGQVPLRFEDGKLSSLPEEFLPAEFDQKTRTLTVAGKSLSFPDVISNLFPANLEGISEEKDTHRRVTTESELRFFASWGHGPSFTPPYLYIDIFSRDEDVTFRVWVDIVEVEVMKAEAMLRSKDGKVRTIPIDISSGAEENVPEDWRVIIGDWFAAEFTIRISEDSIEALRNGVIMDYPNGAIKPIQPGVMLLTKQDGDTEKFSYRIKDDILELYFLRAFVPVARLGTESDKMWRRLRRAMVVESVRD